MDPLAVSHRHPGEERLHCSIQSVAFFSCDCCLALSPTEMELILVGPGCSIIQGCGFNATCHASAPLIYKCVKKNPELYKSAVNIQTIFHLRRRPQEFIQPHAG